MATAVLIVNYRTYPELARCLSSLVPFLDRDDEVVVVDQECDPRALEAAVASVPRAQQLRRADNRGFAAGINLAAAATRAPFLLVLNPDTIVEGPVVRELEAWLTSRPDVGVAGAAVLNEDGSVQASARRFPDLTTWFGGRTAWLSTRFPGNWFSRRNLVGRDGRTPVEVDWVSGSCFMTRRDVFEQVGGFDESFFLYWEDADYCRRVAAAGYRRMYLPMAAVRHIGGRSADHDPARAIRAFHRSAFHLYWKHASPLRRLTAPAVRAGLWIRGEWRVRQAMKRGHRVVR